MSLNIINKTTGEAIPVCSRTHYADAPIGTIFAYASSIAPRDFLPCDRQVVYKKGGIKNVS